MAVGCIGSWLTLAGAAEGPDAVEASSVLITRMADIWDMSEQQKVQAHPVRMEVVANYYDPHWKLLWGMDGQVNSYMPLESTSAEFRSGQRVLIEGMMVPARGLPLGELKLTVLTGNALPEPLDASGRIGDAAALSLRMVKLEGYVNRQAEIDPHHQWLELAVEGRVVAARVLTDRNEPIPQLENALVRITALYVATADAATPGMRIDLWVPSTKHIQSIGSLFRDARFEQPVTPIDALRDGGDFVRVTGTVKSQVRGVHLVVCDDTGQVTVRTALTRPIDSGIRVEAVGLPATQGGERVLLQGLYRPMPQMRPLSRSEPGIVLLRTIEQVRALTPAETELAHPVRLSGVVTWSDAEARFFYMRDASGGLRVEVSDPALVIPAIGSRIVMEGEAIPGTFAPAARARRVVSEDTVDLAEPRYVTLEHAMTGVEEGERIGLSGYVRSKTRAGSWMRLELTTSAGEFSAILPIGVADQVGVGSVVGLGGICAAITNTQRQLVGIQLWVGRGEDVVIEEPAPADPFAVPLRTIASLRQFSTLAAVNRRVRISGVVLNHNPGISIDLQEGAQSLRLLSSSTEPLAPGDRVEAVGFAGRQGDRVVLREVVCRRMGHEAEPAAVPLGWLRELQSDLDGRLVTIEARLLEVGVQPDGFRLLCESGGVVFEALLAGPDARREWRRGSRVSLRGVYGIQQSALGRSQVLQVRLRSPQDVQILHAAPWWTLERALLATAVLGLGIVLGLVWVNVLRHRVARQTTMIREQLEKAARLESELVRSSRLESLGVLAGGIAHDFNNLLTVVMGNLSLVLTDEQTDPEAKRFLRESERAALRARDLTQQLLTFSKGGAPVRAAVLLPDIVREAAGFAQHGSSVSCRFSFEPNLWAADADKGQIAQVIHNIVINAVQAMPQGGSIRLTLRNEEVTRGEERPLAPGRYVSIGIVDEGPGIPPEQLSRIFDPYFTTKERGSGLGLATVYSIVKKHHGHIEVRSKLGEGTTFQIWLPAAEFAPAEAVVATVGQSRWSGRVLVLDDEEPIRQFMTTVLTRMGFTVTAVNEGTAAVREYVAAREAGNPYCLAILDLTIPGAMGGVETLQKLRAVDPTVRAVVSSGYAKDPVVANYRSFGFQGIMPKPYLIGDVSRVIQEVMSSVRVE